MVVLNRIITVLRSRCYCSVVPLENLKRPSDRPHTKKYIADKIRIHVRGGSGGQGCPSAGGIGGRGGNVFIRCMQGTSLAQYTLRRNRRIVAGHGSHYTRGKLKVDTGKDVYITVPPGTEIKSGENTLLFDMDTSGRVIKIANGGVGGSQKTHDFNGQKGEKKNIILELKTIADACLTGFPNAGKSLLLRALSRATPKVGSYPFTTINPLVGSLFYSDSRQVQVADLPGLIEDAHLNKGMGHKFLRHIERTNVVVLVIDINGFRLNESHPYRSPFDMIILLLKELALYQELLLSRPFLLVFNKMDTVNASRKLDVVFNELVTIDTNNHLLQDVEFGEMIVEQVKRFSENNFADVFNVSAKESTGINDLKLRLYDHIHGEDME